MTTVLAATADGLWSSDGSRSLAGHDVVDLDAGWVIVDGNSLWRDGQERVKLAGPPATCVAVAGDTLLIGTQEAHLLQVRGDGDRAARLESFETAEGRDGWYTPWGGPPDTRSLAVAPDGTVYVNVHVGGILRAANGGWVPTIDVDADVHEVLAVGDDGVLAATAYGLARSHDRGSTWSFSTAGLHGEYCRAVAVAGDWLLLSASTGPSTDRAAVYRRRLDAPDDVPFERCTSGLPDWFAGNVNTGQLAAGSGSVAAVVGDGDLYLSQDGGAAWERAATGLATVRRLRLT